MIPVLHGVWSAGAVAADYEHIETITVGAGGAASVTFSSIPQTYKHLQIRGTVRGSTTSTGGDHILANFNGDTGANYTEYHYLQGNGASATSSNAVGGTRSWFAIDMANANKTAGMFGAFVSDILDYTSTSKNKTIRSLCGSDWNGSGNVYLISSLWRPSTPVAITSVAMTVYLAANFAQHSTFSLYGVK